MRNAGHDAQSERAHAEAEDRWSDIDFMMDQGLSAHEISRRIGVSPVALARQAYRFGWPERARRFNFSRKQAA